MKVSKRCKQAYREQLQINGPTGEMTLEAQSAMADAFVIKGEPAAAEPLLRSLVEEARQIYGNEHAAGGRCAE